MSDPGDQLAQPRVAIHAPAETVWAILTDAAAYPEFDPSCERIEGTIALGHKLRAYTKLSPGRAFPVKVAELVPGEKMKWSPDFSWPRGSS